MPVAKVAFSYFEPVIGEYVQISQGEHVLDDRHESVLQFPGNFGPGPFGRASSRSRAIPLAGRRAAGTSLRRRTTGTTPRIVLSWTARDELDELASSYDGDEAACGLFGHRASDGTIVIDDAKRMSDWARRSRTSVEVEADYYRQIEARYRAAGSPTRFIGDAHLHDGPVRPSDVDLRGWKRSVRPVIGYHLGLIVGLRFGKPDNMFELAGWPYVSEIRGWVTQGGATVPCAIER